MPEIEVDVRYRDPPEPIGDWRSTRSTAVPAGRHAAAADPPRRRTRCTRSCANPVSRTRSSSSRTTPTWSRSGSARRRP